MTLRTVMSAVATTLVLLLAVALFALWINPPALLRVGANYAAKIVCSNVFLAGRNPDEVLHTDVQAPGVALLRLMQVTVDWQQKVVHAGLLGFIGRGLALARPTTGCAAIPDGNMEYAKRVDALVGPGMRAIVVIDHGRLVAERYSSGFSANIPLLGWSMTKSVLAGLVGILVKEGQLNLDQSAGFAHDQPLQHPPGEFWSYSSGSANILSRIAQDAAGRLGATVARAKLFDPLGMTSATLETDEDGTLVGSSYMYATARDWARYGQFLLQEGVWQGQALLPAGYVAMMATPVASSEGQYGHGLVWLWGSDARVPGKNPDSAFGIPAHAPH